MGRLATAFFGNVTSAEYASRPLRHRDVRGGVSAKALELVGSAAVNSGRALNTAALRVNFLSPFRIGPESRYEGTALRVGRGSGLAEARALGDGAQAAIIARLTAYLG